MLIAAAIGWVVAAHAAATPSLSWSILGHIDSGIIGAAIELVETGQGDGFHRDDAFPMQSVYKLPIAMAVLDRIDRGQSALDRTVAVDRGDMVPAGVHSPIRDAHPDGVSLSIRDLIRLAIVESDGTASDVLLREAGGPATVTTYLRGLDITAMSVATSERAMAGDATVQYRNSASPGAAVQLLVALQQGHGVSPQARALLLHDLAASTTFPTRLKGQLPAGTPVAHKTGTDGTRNGCTAATNDIGIITLPDGRHVAVAVFIKDSRASAETRDAAIARIGRAAYDRWRAAK